MQSTHSSTWSADGHLVQMVDELPPAIKRMTEGELRKLIEQGPTLTQLAAECSTKLAEAKRYAVHVEQERKLILHRQSQELGMLKLKLLDALDQTRTTEDTLKQTADRLNMARMAEAYLKTQQHKP